MFGKDSIYTPLPPNRRALGIPVNRPSRSCAVSATCRETCATFSEMKTARGVIEGEGSKRDPRPGRSFISRGRLPPPSRRFTAYFRFSKAFPPASPARTCPSDPNTMARRSQCSLVSTRTGLEALDIPCSELTGDKDGSFDRREEAGADREWKKKAVQSRICNASRVFQPLLISSPPFHS